jgi:hypothetical protein
MVESARKQRNLDRMAELFPTFRARLRGLIQELEGEGWRPRIQQAWRSPEEQRRAFESGHSKLRFGYHNVTGDGGRPEALAVDLLDDDNPLNPRREYLLRLAAAAERRRMTTGVRWGLPQVLRNAIDQAIAAGDWRAPVKIGWDPCHVEPTDVTVTAARNGKRPA